MNKCYSQYKNKITRENEVETDNSYCFMKNVHKKVLKYRKKDNDYGYEWNIKENYSMVILTWDEEFDTIKNS